MEICEQRFFPKGIEGSQSSNKWSKALIGSMQTVRHLHMAGSSDRNVEGALESLETNLRGRKRPCECKTLNFRRHDLATCLIII